jgi:hypothetical protein
MTRLVVLNLNGFFLFYIKRACSERFSDSLELDILVFGVVKRLGETRVAGILEDLGLVELDDRF